MTSTTKNPATKNTACNTLNPIYMQSCHYYGKDNGVTLFNADAVVETIVSNDLGAWSLFEEYKRRTEEMLITMRPLTDEEAKFHALMSMLADAYCTETVPYEHA